MKRKIFSIYDVKAQTHGTPFFFLHKGEALRAFMSVTNDPGTSINKYPADFKLHMLGEYDDQSGKLISLPSPEYLGTASDFIEIPKIQTLQKQLPLEGEKNVKDNPAK